jgi:RNA polymerase sigma-54 factor
VAIELKLQLKMSQQLVMTPQLQQAIKLLQLNRLELVNVVRDELNENPVLEEFEGDDDPTPGEIADMTPGEERGEAEASGDADPAAAELEGLPDDFVKSLDGTTPEPGADAAAPAETPEGPGATADTAEVSPTAEAEAAASDAEASNEEKIADIEWENYMDANPQTGLATSNREDEQQRVLEATLTRRPTLAEHLEWQLQLSVFTDAEREAARWIIGNLDDDGYLQASVEDVSRQSGVDIEEVESALGLVQKLDPTGVAARDLRECLTLQLDALEVKNALVNRIVRDHFDLLTKRDFRGLTRSLGVAIEDVAEACKFIQGLEPRPGRAFSGDDPIYITPDIYVYKVGDEFHILLNEDGLPKLRVNRMYKDVVAKDGLASKDEKDYVHDKLRSAIWLIRSIHQRQRTIYRVMESIIRYQREFFERGINYLRPLNLRDVADDIEMHESTVSRVTTNKYVHTPQGIFELKYFFNSSIATVGGNAVASESVKEKIRKIIANEDTRRPLSDQRIAEMLKSADIDIARRTVTKYREAMNVLSSTKRRQVG